MPKTPKPEPLALEDLGDLSDYEEAGLVRLREKLIADVERIHQESALHAKRIKELNQARSDLQRELAERARGLRAVKHALTQRTRDLQPAAWNSTAAPSARARPRSAGAVRAR